jgi:hypothetical protein
MAYTIKQIKKILNVQEFVAMSNTLSKVYLDFENKEYFIETFTDRERIYKIYCASIYNLIKAIQDSKEYFINTKKYGEFESIINQEYVATDNKYYKKENYKASLFKIIETIRHQVNHSLKDAEDNNILFAAYIDFEILENLRTIINDIFCEVYKQIDKSKIKQIVLSKPKVKYSFDKFDKQVDYVKLKYLESTNEIDKIFSKDNERAIEILREYCNPSNIFDLMNKDEEAMKKYDLIDKEMENLFNKQDKYITKNGNELQKEAMKLLKDFFINNESVTKNEYEKNVKELANKLKELSVKVEENN